MANIFITSDTHFSHAACIFKFKRLDGTPLRDFASVEEMDETMIARWNEVVRPQDKVYHLGDVTMKKAPLELCARLNGHLRLVRGNHDIYDTKEYLKYFDEIWATRVFEDMVLSHIPIHEQSLTQRYRVNVHGHLHHNKSYGHRYLNVCVEHTDYRPLAIEEVRQRVKAQFDAYEMEMDCKRDERCKVLDQWNATLKDIHDHGAPIRDSVLLDTYERTHSPRDTNSTEEEA